MSIEINSLIEIIEKPYSSEELLNQLADLQNVSREDEQGRESISYELAVQFYDLIYPYTPSGVEPHKTATMKERSVEEFAQKILAGDCVLYCEVFQVEEEVITKVIGGCFIDYWKEGTKVSKGEGVVAEVASFIMDINYKKDLLNGDLKLGADALIKKAVSLVPDDERDIIAITLNENGSKAKSTEIFERCGFTILERDYFPSDHVGKDLSFEDLRYNKSCLKYVPS